jgi:uncharacterized membrane protein YhhN
VNAGTAVLLGLAAVAAVGDWVAVHGRRRVLEYACKPATLGLLVGAAVAIDADGAAVRAWFVAALVLSLLGDVFLMLPRDAFIPGLASFLLAHVAYIGGFWADGIRTGPLLVGVVLVALAVAVIGTRIVRALRQGPHSGMAIPVAAYMTVISAMVASAVGTGEPWAISGAILFFSSDAMIAWERFVARRPWQRLAIIVTYHLGQFGLVLFLTT